MYLRNKYQKSRVITGLIILYIVGIYINIHLSWKDLMLFANIISNTSGLFLFFIFFRKGCLNKNRFMFFCSLIGLSLISVFLTPRNYPGVTIEKIKALAQIIITLLASLGFYKALERSDSNALAKMLLFFLLILLGGAFLERIIPFLKTLSDVFRNHVYTSGIYENDLRDIMNTGFVRPKFFAREPSFLSHMIVILSLGWYLLTNNKNKIILITLIFFAGIIITGSPKIILIYPLILIVEFEFPTRIYIGAYIRKNSLILFMLSFPFFLCISLAAFYLMANRLIKIIHFQDASTMARLIIPAIVMVKTLISYPIFGVGIGARENLVQPFTESINNSGVSGLYYRLSLDESKFVMTHNYIEEIFIYFGMLGTLIFLYIFNRYLLVQFKKTFVFKYILFIVVLSLMGSAFVTVRAWFELFFFLYCFKVAFVEKYGSEIHKI